MATDTSRKTPADPKLLKTPSGFIAMGLGSGLSPFAPGTAGSLAALPFAWWLKDLPLGAYLFVLLAATVLGFYVCEQVGRHLGVHDHGSIVWDEFCGLWLSVILIPKTWPWLILGFFVFRFCDIVKPWPARWFDRRMSNGVGVMLDDIAAGLWSLLILLLLERLGLGHWLPSLFGVTAG